MTTVFLLHHGLTFRDVETHAEGIQRATEIVTELKNAHIFNTPGAFVDITGGLVIVEYTNGKSWHFPELTCGYIGPGPKASAKVLSVLGFESEQELRKQTEDEGNSQLMFLPRI